MVRKTTPQLPESSTTSEPVEKIELIQVAWSELVEREENIEAQLRDSKREVELQPRKLQEKMEKIILEGNNARETLHKRTAECTKIFREISDWMGIISRCNQTLEDLHVKIQSLNEEAANTLDPLEQQEKFDKIQQATMISMHYMKLKLWLRRNYESFDL
jgi:chromosome segregation ATPase